MRPRRAAFPILLAGVVAGLLLVEVVLQVATWSRCSRPRRAIGPAGG